MRGLMLFGLLAGAVAAQSPYGRISGRVTDPTGAAVAGAAVKAVNTETNVAIAATSTPAGNYDLSNVPIGEYRLQAELAGFKQYSRAGVEVRISDSLAIDITLEVGAVSETINVTAESPLLESASADMGQVVDNRRIVDLPLAGGNPMYLTQLAPAVVQTTSPGHGWLPQATGPTSNAVVAGTKNGSSEFTIDGIPNMSRGGQIAFSPPPEMIQEFRVQTAPFDASAGHFTGASITMVLKSGTNDLHGTLFYSHLSRPLMTRPFFVNRSIYDTSTGPVTPDKVDLFWPYVRTNRYRATFGGPVYIPHVYNGRNRTFWTFGFDWLDRMRPEQQFFTVPTAAQRGGDFSSLLALGSQYQIYDPATIKPSGTRFSRSPFPGNIIPASRISPMASKLIDYYPLPNTSGAADGGDNYFDARVRTIDYKSQIGRIDHQFNENHRIYASLSMFGSSEHAQRSV
ncbi:MAG: carboxypeptidase-like regulatory domain-containing protein, partial [Acidobacteria bacterium]|nr:carboxypeptidase-like regulatory domain-containing protein [Acidobacteriota bacterium]